MSDHHHGRGAIRDVRRVVLANGARAEIGFVRPPDVTRIDTTTAPGPLSTAMLEQARAALRTWQRRPQHDESAQDVRTRALETRRERRGEDEHDADARGLTTAAELDQLVAAELYARELLAGERPLDLDVVRELHRLVVGADEVVRWRTDERWLARGAERPDPDRFQPAVPELVPGAMRDLGALLAAPGDPVVRAAIVAAQIPAIHPWTDGNGRTARVVSQLLLGREACAGRPAPDVAGRLARRWGDSEVLLRRWLVEGDLDPWVAAFAGAVVQSAENGMRRRGARGIWRRFRRESD